MKLRTSQHTRFRTYAFLASSSAEMYILGIQACAVPASRAEPTTTLPRRRRPTGPAAMISADGPAAASPRLVHGPSTSSPRRHRDGLSTSSPRRRCDASDGIAAIELPRRSWYDASVSNSYDHVLTSAASARRRA